jgi:stress response protein SCP2
MTSTDFTKAVADGQSLTLTGHIRLGAAWDTSTRGKGGLLGKLAKRAGGDLDALAILCQNGNPVRMAGLDNNDPMKDGSVLHSGDNQTGKGEGDDETIDLHLGSIDSSINEIYLVVSAFKETNKRLDDALGTSGFGGVENVEFRFYDMGENKTQPLFRIMPSLMGSENTNILARLTRSATASGAWDMAKLDQMVKVTHGDRNALLRSVLGAR